jgi:hypothetical protein
MKRRKEAQSIEERLAWLSKQSGYIVSLECSKGEWWYVVFRTVGKSDPTRVTVFFPGDQIFCTERWLDPVTPISHAENRVRTLLMESRLKEL